MNFTKTMKSWSCKTRSQKNNNTNIQFWQYLMIFLWNVWPNLDPTNPKFKFQFIWKCPCWFVDCRLSFAVCRFSYRNLRIDYLIMELIASFSHMGSTPYMNMKRTFNVHFGNPFLLFDLLIKISIHIQFILGTNRNIRSILNGDWRVKKRHGHRNVVLCIVYCIDFIDETQLLLHNFHIVPFNSCLVIYCCFVCFQLPVSILGFNFSLLRCALYNSIFVNFILTFGCLFRIEKTKRAIDRESAKIIELNWIDLVTVISCYFTFENRCLGG